MNSLNQIEWLIVGYRPLIYKLGETPQAERALLLDRDNTVVIDEFGYLYEPSKLKLVPGVVEGLRLAKSLGYAVAILTNQSGIGRGYFTARDMEIFHDHLLEVISGEENLVQLIIVCPHSPDVHGIPLCECRKPNSEMIFQALGYFNADADKSILIGDKESDLIAAERLGVRGIDINDFSGFLTCCENVL
jgi:histidinol-phosphate phosphatase family protein